MGWRASASHSGGRLGAEIGSGTWSGSGAYQCTSMVCLGHSGLRLELGQQQRLARLLCLAVKLLAPGRFFHTTIVRGSRRGCLSSHGNLFARKIDGTFNGILKEP